MGFASALARHASKPVNKKPRKPVEQLFSTSFDGGIRVSKSQVTHVQCRRYNRDTLFAVTALVTSKLENGGHWYTEVKGITITPPIVPQDWN